MTVDDRDVCGRTSFSIDCPNCGVTVNCYKINLIHVQGELDLEILKILSGSYWQKDLAARKNQELVRVIKDLIQRLIYEHGKEAFEAGHDCIPYWSYEDWVNKKHEYLKNEKGGS